MIRYILAIAPASAIEDLRTQVRGTPGVELDEIEPYEGRNEGLDAPFRPGRPADETSSVAIQTLDPHGPDGLAKIIAANGNELLLRDASTGATLGRTTSLSAEQILDLLLTARTFD